MKQPNNTNLEPCGAGVNEGRATAAGSEPDEGCVEYRCEKCGEILLALPGLNMLCVPCGAKFVPKISR